jgi:hypothetical protein
MDFSTIQSDIDTVTTEHGTHTSERDAFLLGPLDDHWDADAGGKDKM